MTTPSSPPPKSAPRLSISKAQILHLLAIPLTALGGLVTAYVAKIVPGVHIDFTATFITGAGAALGILIHYLHGWQWWERNVAPTVDVTAELQDHRGLLHATHARVLDLGETVRRAFQTLARIEQRLHEGPGGDVEAALDRLDGVEAAVAKLEAKVAKRRAQPAKPPQGAPAAAPSAAAKGK